MSRGNVAGVSAFGLKMAAITGMTACHAGILGQDLMPFWLYCVCEALGGLTFPIMAFLVSEGYRHTSNCRRYAMRLAIFAALSQIPYSIFFEPLVFDLGQSQVVLPFTGNVLFTLLLGLGLVAAYDRLGPKPTFWALFAVGTACSAVLDWGVLGPIMVLMAHVLEEGVPRRVYPCLVPLAALGLPALFGVVGGDVTLLPDLLYNAVGVTAAAVLIFWYDGRRGRGLKWFFYAYYPLHIAVIGLAVRLMG